MKAAAKEKTTGKDQGPNPYTGQGPNPFTGKRWAGILHDLYWMAYNNGHQDAMKKIDECLKSNPGNYQRHTDQL
tara:strand:+ start:2952 stop:3173 length:222 start_codon:yes stop_codon:yes gene_type:complete